MRDTSNHRNLVIVLTGGMRADVFGHTGVWPLLTPHLDEMMEGGLSTVSVAPSTATAPALMSLYSGLHPRQHGLLNETHELPHVDGWAQRLHEAGYYMVGVGRVGPIRHYLDEARPVAEIGAPNDAECDYLQFVRKQGVEWRVQLQKKERERRGPFSLEEPLDEPSQDVDGYIAGLASTILQRMPTDQSWAMVVAFTGPGNDLPAPMPYLDVMETDTLDRNVMPIDFADADNLGELDYPRSLLQGLTPKDVARVRQHYLARVSLVDCGVGMLRDAIDRNGHAHRTWMLLASDHGKLLGEHGLIGHRSILAPAMYTPMLIMPPEGKRPTPDQRDPAHVPDTLVSNVDLAATICAIAQTDTPAGCVGQSLLPGLAGHEVGHPTALCEFGHRLVFETLQHKVAFDVESLAPRALFDLVKDPAEKRNLLESLGAGNALDTLRWQLAEALMPLRPVRLGG